MNLLYDLWLHDICEFDPKKVDKCLYIFENAYNVFHSKPYSIDRIRALGLSGFLSCPKDLSNAERILSDCREKDIHIITIDDEDYPALLREIFLPPRILFVKGSIKNFNDYFPVSIVGTRHSTSNGNLFVRNLSEKLVKDNNIIIISGMAEGIDTQAHKGALSGGGKTIAVLAGGVDIIYPPSNRRLYYEILQNGAVISEKPPGTIGKPYFYNMRNRIIAGLARAVVIAEGSYKSGARFTAEHAVENNRDVFAVPSNPMAVQSQLPNRLIKEGAQVVLKAEDIIEQYFDVYPEYFNININNNICENKTSLLDKLTQEERKIVECIIQKGGKAHIDELADSLNMSINSLNATLTVLLIKEILYQETQNEYLLKEVEYFAN